MDFGGGGELLNAKQLSLPLERLWQSAPLVCLTWLGDFFNDRCDIAIADATLALRSNREIGLRNDANEPAICVDNRDAANPRSAIERPMSVTSVSTCELNGFDVMDCSLVCQLTCPQRDL
jgi:hypothetical protein